MTRTVFVDAARMPRRELIKNGISLWEEEARSRPLFKLTSIGDLPAEFSTRDPDVFRMLVLEDGMIPASWNRDSPYPYKGLLISAAYFLAAQNAENSGQGAISWGLIVQAYYYLGTNSSPLTTQESASAAATARHETYSGNLQRAVLSILSSLESDPTVTSIAEARRRVCESFSAPPYAQILQLFSEAGKGLEKDGTKTPMDRLADLLAKWSLPSYQAGNAEVWKAFSRFKRKRASELILTDAACLSALRDDEA